MKKYIITVLLLIAGVQFSLAQKQAKNPKDEFTYKNITLSDTDTGVISFNGAVSKSTANKPHIASRNTTGNSAGKTFDELTVSLTGGVNYDVPIVVPAGINGVIPEVSLNYNSQSGNGIAGYGWNIKGVSVITRVAATKYHDNIIDPVDFDRLDRFSLDGKRLLLKSGSYGGNGAQYQTESYSNLKITSHGTSPFGANYGPAYFKVHYPDGSIAFYGNTTNSRSKTNYAITYWQNPQGIRISYEYLQEFNGLTISKIKYGSKTTAAPKSEIRFTYDQRSVSNIRKRSEQAYINGISFVRRHILKGISVYGGTQQYRKYLLSHDDTSLDYTRLTSIREYGKNDSSYRNPITFNYNNTSSSVNYSNKTASLSIANIEQRNAETKSLDITGNGKMDFIVIPKTTKNKFWLFKDLQKSNNLNLGTQISTGGNFEDIFPVTWLNTGNKVLSGQGITVVQNTSDNKVKFKTYSDGTVTPIYYQYEKTWNVPTYEYATNCNSSTLLKVPQKYISGDFNGDGLTDIIAISKSYTNKSCTPRDCNGGPGPGPMFRKKEEEEISEKTKTKSLVNTAQRSDCCDCYNFSSGSTRVNFINLDRRVTSNFAKHAGYLSQKMENTDTILTADVNADGKTDILHFSNGKIYVYTLDKNNNLSRLWTTNDSFIKTKHPFLLGDYNGDGKTDFITPKEDGDNTFGIYISTGKAFSKLIKTQPFAFRQTNWNGKNGVLSGYNLIPLDINGDGRTDLVEYKTKTYNNNTNGSQELKIYNNRGVSWKQIDPGYTGFIYGGSATKTGDLKHFPIPIFLSSDKPNKSLEFAAISDKWVTSFNFTQDHREEVLLRSVQNNGVTYAIDYRSLDPEEQSSGNFRVYQSETTQTYPYVDIKTAPSTKVVTTLQRMVSGSPNLKQHFAYYGAMYNMEGLGFLGFKGIAQSNWHTDAGDRIFTVSKYDPTLRGAIVQEYSQPNYFSFNNASSNFITKTTYTNSSSTSTNKVFKLKVDKSTTQNNLQGTTQTTSYTYDSYNNLTRITTNYNGTGSSVVTVSYANSTGTTYYIGRPVSEKETMTIGSNAFSTEKQYSYSGYFLNQRKTKGNGTNFDIENFTYDAYGNVIKRVIVPHGTPAREVRFQYDTTGRFLIKGYDIEGLSTTYKYDTAIGTLLSETNHFGQKTTYTHDSWNRAIKITDYLGKNLSTVFTGTNNVYTVTNTGDDGSGKITINDALGRVTIVKEKNALGQWTSKKFEYDALDRIIKESEPYLGSSPTQWNTTSYDLYGRTIGKLDYTGRATNISYSGLSVTVNDGTKTVITTKDAMGNVIRTKDPGGTINYTFFGNGAIKTSNYNGVVVATEQDGWGRKTKLIDPSAGTYTYTYNGFGQITKETTPKGSTTYTYDATGKTTNEKIVGDLTNINANYVYDTSTKLIKKITGKNNRTNENYQYTYLYDSYNRLKSTREVNAAAEFDYSITRDGFGRVATEAYLSKSTISANKLSSSVKVKNTYNSNSGELTQIRDHSSNKILWELKTINQRGQATLVNLGNGIHKTRTFNSLGFATKILDKTAGSTPKNILNLEYTFDGERGNLLSRKNNNFGWNERFTYDNLDRLTKITGAVNMSHAYDTRGKITTTSDIGAYSYTSNNSYQLKNVELNTKGDLHFQNNSLQKIKYNSFKKPISISQQGSGKADFSYGILRNRSHAYYGGDQEEILNRRYEKHYSAVSPVEIEVDKQGRTKIVTYVGGDAYSAPIVHIKQTGAGGVNGYHYLHRDYLGSILAITDENATIKEQRQFGAWGEVDKFRKDNSEIEFDHTSLLNRGYTGHEHFFEVGLIHMNGRMYDAKMKRFLAPDNYIQDPYNTQNYNRYSYVLNNPLKYTDPSGEFILELGAALVFLAKAVFVASAAYAIYGFTNLWSEDSGGGGSPQNQATPTSGQSNSQEISSGIPILDVGTSHITNLYGVLQTNSMFSTTSSEVAYATSGPNDWIANGSYIDLLRNVPSIDPKASFVVGAYDGIKGGLKSSWNFIKSLGTKEGWKNLGKGFLNMVEIANGMSVRGQLLRSQAAVAVVEFAEKIPNMNAYEAGYYIGYGVEKIGEVVVLSKGVSAITNTVKNSSVLRGGKTFKEFKKDYWSTRTKPTLDPIINPTTGQVWKQYTELHHVFIPQRWRWPNWITNNRLNLKPVSSLKHAQMDPFRARFAPKWIKEAYNLKWK